MKLKIFSGSEEKINELLEELDDHADVQNIYENIES